LTANKIGHQRWQPIKLTLRPAVLDRYVLACDAYGPDDVLLKYPITGNVGCCARTANGHPAAAPPTSVRKSRRLIMLDRFRLGIDAD
jgi:hypothetical protein